MIENRFIYLVLIWVYLWSSFIFPISKLFNIKSLNNFKKWKFFNLQIGWRQDFCVQVMFPFYSKSTDCHASEGWQAKTKLSAVGLSNPVLSSTTQSASGKNDAQLLLEVENELMQDNGSLDSNQLRTSYQNYDKVRIYFQWKINNAVV